MSEYTRVKSLIALLLTLVIGVGCQSEDASDDDEPTPAGEVKGGEEGGAADGGEAAGEMGGAMAGASAGESGGESGAEAGEEMGGEEEPPPLEAPVIRRVRAFLNSQDGGIGLEIIGRDEDNNVLAFGFEFIYDDGSALQLGEMPGPIYTKFNNLSQGNGDYVGVWSVPFLPGGGAELERLERVRVSIIDETEYESPISEVELLPTPTSDDGEDCDIKRGLSRCDEGLLCKARPGGRTQCAPAVAECPEYYETIDLNMEGGSYEGDTTDRPTLGIGFCGGGTGAQVFRFTADSAGRYAFTSQPLTANEGAPTGPDTLMWIRSHCEFSDWVAELGCNDDINPGVGDLGSQIILELEEGQVIFIFVDGYADIESGMPGWSGQYLLEAVAL